MTISAISRYRGGSMEDVVPLARSLKAIYLKYEVSYRLGRFQTESGEGDWFVVVTYADQNSYDDLNNVFADDIELQQIFHAIAKFATRVSRELVIDVEI